MIDLLCLEEREWWNLCERGYVRLLIGRVVPWDEQARSTIGSNKLFAVAPNVRLESSDSLVVLVLDRAWRSAARARPDGPEGDVVDLPITAVTSFHPVREEDRALLLAGPRGATFQLGEAVFVGLWEHWLLSESVRTRSRAGFDLAAAAGVPIEYDTAKEWERWERRAMLLIRPESGDADETVLVERFLKRRDETFRGAEEDQDSQAHLISASVLWVNDVAGIDLETKHGELYTRLANVWSALAEDSATPQASVEHEAIAALHDLSQTVPSAFSDELTAQSLSVFLKTFRRVRSEVAPPEEVLDAITKVRSASGIAAAQLVAFLLGVELGSEKVFQLRQFLAK